MNYLGLTLLYSIVISIVISTVISKLDSKFQIRENLILIFSKVENRSFFNFISFICLFIYLFIYILA